jgi:hypothetical protein
MDKKDIDKNEGKIVDMVYKFPLGNIIADVRCKM